MDVKHGRSICDITHSFLKGREAQGVVALTVTISADLSLPLPG